MEELINKINHLAHKEKTIGLSEAEKAEQQELRQQYLEAFRKNFKSQISTIKIVDEEGQDVTPPKLKELKEENKGEE
ncbi:DUF896 domain-containing protein [Allofustis seminis]|uniref:DUF896 domain-containing protein n=1 Tax=Allofustis seminis TaxID=166939 RepID=UPI00035D0D10|nr:DUF896 domain-containing protein [Allofustis seminis]